MSKARDIANKGPVAATTAGNTFSGAQNFALATVASHASTADIWGAAGNKINWTGTATTVAFPAAPQPGVERELVCAGTCSFTAGPNMLIDGVASGSSIVCSALDKVSVLALTTTQFKLSREKIDGTAEVSSGSMNFTASGAISAGQIVVLKSGVAETVLAAGLDPAGSGAQANYDSGIYTHLKTIFDPINNVVVVFYIIGTYVLWVKCGTVAADGTISFAGRTAVSIGNINGNLRLGACYAGAGKVVLTYMNTSGFVRACVGTIASNDITVGAEIAVSAIAASEVCIVYNAAANGVQIAYAEPFAGGNYGYTLGATISGTTLSLGSLAQFNSLSYTQAIMAAYDANLQRVVLAWRKGQVGESSYLSLFSQSGNSVSLQASTVVGTYQIYPLSIVYDETAATCLYAYIDQAVGSPTKIARVVATANSMTGFAGSVFLNAGQVVHGPSSVAHAPWIGKTVWAYTDSPTGKIFTTYVTAGVITVEASTVFVNETIGTPMIAADTSNSRLLVATMNATNIGFALSYTSATANASRWIGAAKAAAANGESVSVALVGSVSENQSGLTTGVSYYINSNTGALSSLSSVGPKIGKAIAPTKLLLTGAAA